MKVGILFLMLLTIFSNIYSQNSRMGIGIDFYSFNEKKVKNLTEYKSEYVYSAIPGIYFIYSYKLSEEFYLTLKPGVIISDKDLYGFDIGTYISYNFEKSKFYLLSGINSIFNKGENNGTGVRTKINSSALIFINFGGGYKVSEHLEVSLQYFSPIKKEIGKSFIESEPINIEEKKILLNNIIKLCFNFTM